MKKLIVLALSVFTLWICQAQPIMSLAQPESPKTEYILLKSGEQLIGSVQYDSIKSLVYFQEQEGHYYTSKTGGKYRIIPNDSIAAFNNEKIRYVSKLWDGAVRFVIELATGEQNLFEYQNKFFIESQGLQSTISKSSLKRDLAQFYSERCNWSFNEENLKYSKAFLIHLVKGYNKKDCFKVHSKKMGARLFVGPAKNDLLIQAEQVSTDLKNAATFGIGLQAEFPTYKNSSITLALDFMAQDIEKDFPVQNFDDIFLNVSHIIFRPGIKYYLNNLFVELGILFVFSFSDNSFVTYNQRPDFITTFDLNGTSLGFNGALGYQLLNKLNHSLSIELRNSTFSGSNLDVRTNMVGVFYGF